MSLLERKTYLDDLSGFLAQASRGHGSMLLLGGEAGVGKSALVQAFTRSVGEKARVLTGACDPLSTPRPLGPLLDMSDALGPEISKLIHMAASQSELFRAILADLRRNAPSVVATEDAHWADEATLDLLRYLGRRIADVPALIIVTYRDDETGPDHPLRRVAGELASLAAVRRMALRPLSRTAVAQLATGSQLDPIELFRLTDGNPFFVTEVLSVGESGLPETVRDAVLARATRLSSEARAVLDACAVIGSPIEMWLLEALGFTDRPISECIAGGMLVARESSLAFRHELARQGVLDAISPLTRRAVHRLILAALRTRPEVDAARLAHHAESADAGEAVLEYAQIAAHTAAKLGAHAEAAAQYERALRFASTQPLLAQAELLRAMARECYLTERVADALAAVDRELELVQQLSDPRLVGDALSRRCRMLSSLGRKEESDEALRLAIETLETLPPGPELAVAYGYKAGIHMTAWQDDEAILWGERALALAERLGETDTMIWALANVGAARTTLDGVRGDAELRRSLALALEVGADDHASRIYANLGSSLCFRYQFPEADSVLVEGIAYCADRDLDFYRSYLLCWRAWSLKFQGQWRAASEISQELLAHPTRSAISRVVALTVLGGIYTRQGDARGRALLDEALALALPTGEAQRLSPVRAARAEAAWVCGDLDQVRVEVHAVLDLIVPSMGPWLISELAFWLWRANDPKHRPERLFEPFDLQMQGNWKEAAARWRGLACPYEAAVALADSDDEAALRYAFAEFARLGAQPMMNLVTRKLRALGVTALPRGPRPVTQTNPFQLTSRELEVLGLLVQGQRTQEIADALFLSPRTVSHHITAILAKLDVHTRNEAAAKAVELGIAGQSGHPSPLT